MSSASETVRIIRVFVSSPGDVPDERKVLDEVVESINRTDGSASGVRLLGNQADATLDDLIPIGRAVAQRIQQRHVVRNDRIGP